MPTTSTSTTTRLALATLLALGACSYSYQNPVEALGPGEVGGRTVAGAALVLDGVAVSLKGAALDGASRGNGRFAMLPLPVGRHTLVFRKGRGRAVQREVEIAWGKDGQPGGLWLGDVEVPATSSVIGSTAAPAGVMVADNGLAVDEVSGAVVPVDATGGFRFDELAVGPHRIRVAVSDLGGARYLAGPATFEVMVTDAGTEKVLTPLALRASLPTAPPARVTIRVGVVGAVPGLTPTDLILTGLDQSVPLQSNGEAQVELAEGLWTVGLQLPAGFDTVTAPTPITFVAGQGEAIDLGSLYAVADAAASLARLACHADADCAPGSCTASHVCAGWSPPVQAPASLPFCGAVATGCTPGLPIGTSLPHAALCIATATPNVNVGVPCGGCCTSDGLDTRCGTPGVDGCPDLAASPGAAACSADGWCFVKPLPPSNRLRSAWASSPINGWAVGDEGSLFHWNGSAWSNVASGTPYPLAGVSGTSATDVWAVGGHGTILHWDGTAWSSVASGTTALLNGVWAASPTAAFVVGDGGTVLSWNGTSWSNGDSTVTEALTGVWGTSDTDVWAVGASGTILHWNGFWTAAPSGTTAGLTGIWGSGTNDVWVVGDAGTILRGVGGSWSAATSPTTANLLGVFGSSPENAWAVGDFGELLGFDGVAWTSFSSGTINDLQAGWSSAWNDAWAVGTGGTTLHWNGTAWSPVTGGSFVDYNTLLTGAAGELWAFGWITDGVTVNSATTRLSGGGWTTTLGVTGSGIYAASAASPSDIWVSGIGGELRHWDGTAWSTVPSGTTDDLLGVWVGSASDAWAVGGTGAGGVVTHWDGTSWTSGLLGSQPLYGVWGSAANDVWAVGWGGLIFHWDGAAWSPFLSGTGAFLNSIWGSGSNDVWAVGNVGTILHWDGTGSWANVTSPVSAGLSTVWGTGPADAWIVGHAGTLLHWDGSSWTARSSGTTNDLWSVFGRSANDLYAVGAHGTILHRGP